MPIIVTQIRSRLDESREDIIQKVLKKLGFFRSDVISVELYKTSLDARRHEHIHYVNSVYISLNDISKEIAICNTNHQCIYISPLKFNPIKSKGNYQGRPIIVGFGPAGIFCGLCLAENGYRPIILERGSCVDDRIKAVSNFWNGGELLEDTNVQFGEGGAGTFSDGKLVTRIKDDLCKYVLERFVEFGAPKDVLTKAKPHIGTDNLRQIVKRIREKIVQLGGEIHFNSKMNDFRISGNRIVSATANGIEYPMCGMVLAVGHSARDTFQLLLDKGVTLEPKPFSVGVRIEHTKESVDNSLYGIHAGNPLLPSGEYQLSHRLSNGRTVYTFCMCPGGYVVPASSELGGVVTNGMSEYARNGKNSNSAMVVSVSSSDYGKNPLDGVKFARSLEHKAFVFGGSNYRAPCTSVGEFLSGKVATIGDNILPTYARGVTQCDLSMIFPDFINDSLKTGLKVFSKKMKCFSDPNALMTAPETRTSSPVRIPRNIDTLTSISIENLYPCGEGAGYSGGITSSAVDGLKVALKLMQYYSCT